MTHVLTVTLNAAIDVTLALPHVRLGGAHTAREVVKLPGGKGVNVARALHGLGVPVVATGLVGGSSGNAILNGLREEGVAARFLTIAGVSRTHTTIVETRGGRLTAVAEPGPTIAPDEARRFLALFAELLADVRVVVLSGSLPPGLPDDYYATPLDRATAVGVPAVLDTSGRALVPALAAAPLLVKPNGDEAAALLREDSGAVDVDVDAATRAGREARARGARLVAVSRGAEGAVLVGEAGVWSAYVEAPEPLDATGSGDAFVGGFVAALCTAVDGGAAARVEDTLARADVLAHALTLATACGAANTRTLGAGILRPDDVARFRAAAVVTRLA